MIRFTIVAVGRLKEPYLVEAAEEYLRRLVPYARVQVHEVPEEPFPPRPSPAQSRAVREQEAARLARHIPGGGCLIALAPRGRIPSSEELAALVEERALAGQGHLIFLVGGPLGLAPALLERAAMVLSFSRLTFPHQLFRVILLEQLYRVCKIVRHEPYHW
ncbi:MAG: 23S rRNA (pseudouridine(1915)-N(3))-methyltransferase RlmH [Thermoanaerobacterales bacterium]|nr:23S rRNA (pseudouridine(1915)-N(3))-methyltransferase RlmH [Thermoanaerobacterales bacterium]